MNAVSRLAANPAPSQATTTTRYERSQQVEVNRETRRELNAQIDITTRTRIEEQKRITERRQELNQTEQAQTTAASQQSETASADSSRGATFETAKTFAEGITTTSRTSGSGQLIDTVA